MVQNKILSLNADKSKYSFFHKPSQRDNIPLRLPSLSIDKFVIKRSPHIKFLGVILDENLSWREHIRILENKISKNLGLLYKARTLLNENCLKSLYFSYIHSYLNYANIAWASTNKTCLKSLFSKQKQAIRIVCNEEKNTPYIFATSRTDKITHSKPLFKSLNVLNVYQLNIFQTLIFMQKNLKGLTPLLFHDKFKRTTHKYPTTFSQNNFVVPKHTYKKTKFSISVRGPRLWNEMLNSSEKETDSHCAFKNKVKAKLFSFPNEAMYF